MVRAGNEDRLAKNIADMGYDSGEAQKFMESFAKDLTDEQLQLAINVSATAESIDEFKREF
jgi:hypothetical protein